MLQNLSVEIYADGADRSGMLSLYENPLIKGLTTNPTLMRKAGISDYEKFAREILEVVREKPVSFEVFSDDFGQMRRQALKIASWQKNVFVKIPVTNSLGESSAGLIRELAEEGVQLNVTALLTIEQVSVVAGALRGDVPSLVSVFAGRIADTGRDPIPMMREALRIISKLPSAKLLWASVREVLNIYQAAAAGVHIVTVQNDILAKAISMADKNLQELSLDTVQMFARDAAIAGFTL